jgi:geranylgeranylglycerol-phosphate geranylgeranyltransferase
MKVILAYIRLMRPLNLLLGALGILVCGALMESFPDGLQVLLVIGIVWAYTGGGNAFNDYCDFEIDRVNRPCRPLPQGLISRSAALIFAVILFSFGSLLALPVLNLKLALLLVTTLWLLIGYSLYLKPTPFWGNLVVSLVLGVTFLFAAEVFGDIRRGLVPFGLAFGFTLVRELIKDMQDIEGDRLLGARTLPLAYGVAFSRKVTVFWLIVLMLAAPLPFFLGVYGIFYLIILCMMVEIPLGFVLYSFLRDSSARNCARLANILKIDIFFGLLAIYLGKF